MAKSTPIRWFIPEGLAEPRKVESVLELIGETSLVEISRIATGLSRGVKIFAKLEGEKADGHVEGT